MPDARLLSLVLLTALWAVPGPTAQAQRPVGRWLGQDGMDLVGPSSTPGPSDIVDIHIAISGVPANRTVVFALINALGGADWAYVKDGTHRAWRAEVRRKPGSNVVDLYIEPPGVETGRPFEVVLKLDDGRGATIRVAGGKADPTKRVPGPELIARWVGQDGADRVGLGPAVGPDGRHDVRIALENLAAKQEIKEVAIDLAGATGWRSGPNPEGRDNAEIVRQAASPAKADLYFQPDRDLANATLAVRVSYANGRNETARLKAGACDPGRRVAPPKLPRLVPNSITARWLGQDGAPGSKPGDVHVVLDGLDRAHVVAAVALTNGARGAWFERATDKVPFVPEPYAKPLVFRRREAAAKADLFFAPERDETGSEMTLRLVYGDGSATVVRFPGGKADEGLRAGPGPGPSTTAARPGQDLQALVARFGTITLGKGRYELDRPLVISKPVRLTAEPGATLVFSQKPGAPPWSAAILIHSGHVTLEGFAVRFAGPVRYREGIRYGPAVIGVTDDQGPTPKLPIANLTFRNLDLEGPIGAKPGAWEWAVSLMRLVGAESGRVENCVLKGGPIEFFNGPWTIVGNEHRGTPEWTQTSSVVAAHHTHDVLIKDNRTRLVAPAGKTWRFLVMTGSSYRTVVSHNQIEGIGPRDDDVMPHANSPETILTEAYGLHFEGAPLAIAHEGRLLRVPAPQGEPARVGSIVAVLSGPRAGSWSRVAQAIDPTTYLVDPPLPTDASAVSIATGFVDTLLENNTIDVRGGKHAISLVLVGNQFGTRVVGNRVLGGGDAFKLSSCPAEAPVHWGWSHCPAFGVVVEGNTIEGSLKGGLVTVEHPPQAKSSRGRTYLTGRFERNRAVQGAGFTIGEPGALDPGEMVLAESGNTGPALRVLAGTINGRAVGGDSRSGAAPSASRALGPQR